MKVSELAAGIWAALLLSLGLILFAAALGMFAHGITLAFEWGWDLLA